MPEPRKSGKLKKELKLLDVYAIATGTTLSAGFFLLPGLAAEQAGPALILAYLIAALPLLPATLSIIELATAMPRAGGVYYFLDRTLGPYFGTVGGIGTWLALILKVAFSLIGMGAYLSIFIPDVPILTVAIVLAVLLGILNVFGAKKSGRLQIILVFGLLAILVVFISGGVVSLENVNFKNFFAAGFDSIFATAGLVYISYVGVTKVASLSEEVKDPEKNLPKGVILAFLTTMIIYVLGTMVMVGVVPMDEFAGSLTPVALAADKFLGKTGVILLSIAALFAFVSVANAGTLSASRYPLAMSRDHLVPNIFRRLGKTGVPLNSIVLTTGIVVLLLLLFDPLKIAKLASAFQLLMFALVCLAVIVMRESKIESYDPGYKSPLYPWMQIFGIISPLFLIFEMGALSILFSLGLMVIATLWYFYYARKRVMRSGAIYHVFERLGRQRFRGLDSELRGILKEKGIRASDPFEEIVARSFVLEIIEPGVFESVVELAAEKLNAVIPCAKEEIIKQFLDGTRIGATPVTHGIALPHFRSDAVPQTELVLLRAAKGVKIKLYDVITQEEEEEQTVHAIFFLVSPENNPTQHLRILAQIAGRVDEESFLPEWLSARNDQELKESILHDDRFQSITISGGTATGSMINKSLKEVLIPKGCLVTMMQRGSKMIVPNGNTTLLNGDRLTVIGDGKGLEELRKLYIT
jgi:basic amino acid/polyamine antiporter, APA family